MAVLRNLRNMIQAGVDEELIRDALRKGNKSRILPFRYIAAATHAPRLERELDQAMMESMKEMPRLVGKTAVLVDVSGSMSCELSSKSDLDRIDAACALAALVAGIAEDYVVYSFSEETIEVPPRQGMALIDAIKNSQRHQGTYLGRAIKDAAASGYDRIIVITDEQSHDRVGPPLKGTKGYIINVASYEHGVGYGDWTRISGFSERVISYIQAIE